MAVTGSSDSHEKEQLGGKCLGVGYEIEEDVVVLRLDPYFYAKKAKSLDQSRDVIILRDCDIGTLQAGKLFFSHRQALSMIMGLYDPLGLVGPALVAGKLLLCRLYTPEYVTSWDQDLPSEEKQRWASWFRSIKSAEKAVFPRAMRPRQAMGQPRMAGFCDSSEVAMCAAIYVVWDTKDAGHLPSCCWQSVEWPLFWE